MEKLIHSETNLETGEVIERELTAEEIKARNAISAELSQAIADNAAKAEQKAALLERLGISEEEAKLLLA